MLVLGRRTNESIIIDGNIEVRVLDVGSDRVRLGITAPSDVSVDREEIHHKKMSREWEDKNGH